MGNGAIRERPGSEVVFSVLRVLSVGYCLWGSESKAGLLELVAAVGTNAHELAKAVDSLRELDLVALDSSRHTVSLGVQGIRMLDQLHAAVS